MTIKYRAWTNKQIATLRELAELKLTATAIGEHVGATKNAVIGQCHRSGIQLKGLSWRGPDRCYWRKQVAPIVKAQPPAPPPTPPDPNQAVPLIDLKSHHCRQVVSTNGGLAMFCASPKIKAHSYCAFHAARNFRPENLKVITDDKIRW